jgi:deoxyadenosine/deoxycytidine kinase
MIAFVGEVEIFFTFVVYIPGDFPQVFLEHIDQRNRPIENPCFTQRSVKHLRTNRQSKRAWRSNSLLESVAGLHLPNKKPTL